MEFKDSGNATTAALSQKKPECERKAGAGFCTKPGSNEKCKCPKEVLTQLEYGACTKIGKEGGSTACIMRGTTWPTEKDVYCICPEESLAQADPVKKDLPECVHVPGAKGCMKRGTDKESCICPEDEPPAPQFSKVTKASLEE